MKKFFIGLLLFFIHGIITYFPRDAYGFWSIQHLLTSFITIVIVAWIFRKLTTSTS